MAVLGIITARGGSKRLPGKNIRYLAGKPLIAYTIKAAKESGIIDKIVVSTDDDEIAMISEKFGAKIIDRPDELAADESPTIHAILHSLDSLAVDGYVPNLVILLQPTSPLRTGQDIRDAFEIFELKRPDSLVSLTETEEPGKWDWIYSISEGYLVKPIDGEKTFIPNGAIYISTPAHLKKTQSFYIGNVLAYEMPEKMSIDIDTANDFELAESVLLKKKDKVI